MPILDSVAMGLLSCEFITHATSAQLMENYQTTPICYSILDHAFEMIIGPFIYPLWSASLKFGW